MVTCKDCGKEFEQRASYDQHYSAVHAKHASTAVIHKKTSKKPIFAGAGIVIILLIGYFSFFSGDDKEKVTITGDDIQINLDDVPRGPIHWHPTLTVIIHGQQIPIPRNLGGAGATHVAGTALLPYHTHDTTGTLHMETTRPTPDTAPLGYFFEKVWRKTFNSECILDNCNGPDGNLTLLVNGEQNFQYNKFIPKDRDDIRIVFE